MADDNPRAPTLVPIPRMLGTILGIALSIAIAAGVYFWAAGPSYANLYSGLEPQDASEVVTALQAANIPYKVDSHTGMIMVESGRVHEARLKLASQGLPKGTAVGIEMLQQDQGFGTSQFIESARYHHAMETELARTISTMRNVKSARVHLAIPKKSVFVRDQEEPTASVALNLYGGRTIEDGQVNAIVHLVASSIANLAAENVTVVDQNGRLLSSGDGESPIALTTKQFDYTREVEEDYAKRIERLLEPIVGVGKVRATVKADIDFTQQESTEELYNPERTAVRSEQDSENKTYGSNPDQGVPGALSNQPPQGGNLAQGAGNVSGSDNSTQKRPLNSSKNIVKNYEVDRTIRHTKQNPGMIRRLTVGVLVDDHVTGTGNEAERTPLTQQEITRITDLVQQAIGYDQQRGDKVNVINASFTPAAPEEALPPPSLLDEPWVRNLGKQILAGVIILVLIFTIVRPSLKNLTEYTPPTPVLTGPGEGEEGEGETAQGQLGQTEKPLALPGEQNQKLEFAKAMVDQDPKRVANVVKDWIGNEH